MIICFSGTGNSRLVADELARLTGESVVNLRGEYLANPVVLSPVVKRVIWIMPVYSWGTPPVVNTWIERLPEGWGKDAIHHLILTCGDDTGLAHVMWRRMLGHRGMRCGGCYSVTMPNTYVFMKGFDVDAPSVRDSKLSLMSVRVGQISSSIACGFDGDDVIKGKWSWLKTYVIYPWFCRYAMKPSRFNVSEACVSCGRCIAVCPCNNLSMVDGRPVWGNNCTLCSACYHVCPRHAIDYGSSARKKGQYGFNLK